MLKPAPCPPGRFFSQLVMLRVREGREIILKEPLLYRDDVRGFVVMIPKGFRCDGASVPQWAWALLASSWLEYARAGVLHDYASRIGAARYLQPSGEGEPFTCLEAARVFREALLAEGAAAYAARVAELAVRAARRTYWQAKCV